MIKWGKGKPKLEYRSYYLNSDDELKPGKLTGIDYATFKIIGKNNKEIKSLLKEEE